MSLKTDNQIFADFIGLKVRYFGEVLYTCDDDGNIDFTGDAEAYCPDRDWNQLMKVVNKIDMLQMFDSVEYHELSEIGIFAKIDTVYLYVDEFIKWYNENKKV